MSKKTFKLWPQPAPGKPYGPTPKQRLLFIEKLSPEERPHYHNVDCTLFEGGARCLGLDTPVLMYNGTTKKVQDIKLGDLLMGPDSKPRKVEELHRGKDQMYKIVPNKGDDFTCNDSHILSFKTSGLTLRTCGSGNIRPTEYSSGEIVNMQLKDYLKLSSKKKSCYKLWQSNAVVFKTNKKLLIDSYFLGVYLGDGHSASPTITSMDPEIKDFLYSYASHLGLHITESQRFEQSKCKNYHLSTKLRFGGSGKNPLTNLLKFYKVLNNKHIPYAYKTASKSQRLELLAGLIDTDGYLSKGRYYEIAQKNKQLADDIVFLARSLGFKVSIKETRKSCKYKGEKKTGTYYRINISGDIEKIPVKIERRKLKDKLKLRVNPLVSGFKVEPLGEGDYYGFTLSGPDRLFLLGDFTVTHNSGKTVAAVARTIQYLMDYPGTTAIIGAENFPLLQRTALKEWEDKFTNLTPWDHIREKDSIIISKPTQAKKQIQFRNGSRAIFLHFTDPKVLRGIDADIIHYEEASLLPDEIAFNELIARLSGRKGPIRQLILTTNPDDMDGWISRTFKLDQFEKIEEEREPIKQPCNCHFCSICLMFGRGDVEYVGEDGKPSIIEGSKCPTPGCQDAFGNPSKKENSCPGNQQFFRVIKTQSSDNGHLPQDFVQTSLRAMDSKMADQLIRGKNISAKEGAVFGAFSNDNILKQDKGVDYEKDLIWSLDFNYDPQCSVICQETISETNIEVTVLDEITLWNSLPEHVAERFCELFQGFKYTGKYIKIYGDPSALWGKGNNLAPTYYQTIKDILFKNGFNPLLMMRPPEKAGKDGLVKNKVKIFVAERVDATNAMLKNDLGEVRLFLNPKCITTIKSLKGLLWHENGKDIDKRCDRAAKKRLDKTPPLLMSHPSEALGYYIFKRFPLIKDKAGVLFFQIPGEEVVEIREGKLNVKDRSIVNENLEERKRLRKEKRDARRAERERKNSSRNLFNELKDLGLRGLSSDLWG